MANGDFVSKYKATQIEKLLDKINAFDPSSYSPEGSGGSSTGTPGADGKSAYQLALDNGYTGTLEQWLESLKGAPGTPGAPGVNGNDGKSAYQIWLDAGNTGNESDFLNSLKGAPGTPGTPGAPGVNGTNGKSAYQLAVDNGYTGTVQQWLESLKASGSTDIKLSSLEGNILKKLADGLYAGIDFDNEFDVDYIIDMVWGKIADPNYGSSLESNYILNDDKLYRTSDNKIYNVKEAYYGGI